MREAKLILDDGSEFIGRSFGYEADTTGEVVFNTAMTGYPESLTDPSYAGQILVTTYPLIGNYGVPSTDLAPNGIPLFMESDRIHVKALIVADYSEDYSHWNAKESLSAWLKREKIPAITGIDTRRLTTRLREHGVMIGRIEMSDGKCKMDNGRGKSFDYSSTNWVEKVSCKDVITYGTSYENQNDNENENDPRLSTPDSQLSTPKRVVLVDCGVKANIIRCLINRGIEVVRVPWDYDFNQLEFDGLFLANGPGDPEQCSKTVEHIRTFLNTTPVRPCMGICLGNQLLARAAGAKTYKLKYGHRSHNQPVRLVGSTSSNHRYGIFPSFSLGWNIMNEKFMEDQRDWLNNLKLRFSWGKNGNDNIGDFAYTTLTAMGNTSNYYFGQTGAMVYGSKANRLANEDLKWEESEQTDLGIDFGFWNNKLTFSFDYYIKKTNGMIIEMPIPSYVGEARPLANVGDMENSGVEFELGYRWNIADAHFNVKGNASYLKNKLKNLGNDTGFLNYGISQFSDGGTRAENGQPFPFFYGYKTDGIIQNMAEADAYNSKYGTSSNPGDFRFVDTNGDNKINSDDRTNIGNGVPDWTFGLTFDVDWKGFDFGVFFQGVHGADVFDATYRQDIASGNYPTWVLQRWTGEGTSNTVPTLGDSKNWVCSDMYIQDGSYLRLKNITLGYTLHPSLTNKIGISRLRIYGRAENLFTWTKYWGFDPEIGSGSTSLGVDYGIYPQARTFTVGCNLSF